MSRPLRIEFPGAIYQVASRGEWREPIFVDDGNRHALLAVLAQVMDRVDAEVPAYFSTTGFCDSMAYPAVRRRP